MEETKFGDLSFSPFLFLGILCFFKKIVTNILSYNKYLKNVENNRFSINGGELRREISNMNIKKSDKCSIYDPRAIKEMNNNIQNIGKFSLLRVIVWSRHQLPNIMRKYYYLITTHKDKDKDRDESKEKGLDKINKYKEKEKKIEKEEYEKFKNRCRLCIFIERTLIGISVIPFIIPIIVIFNIIIGVSFLSLVIKVSQISFVSELEILDWEYENIVQFIAFLNNILSLDTGRVQSFDSIMSFMFSGADAKEDEKEKEARKRFVNGLISYSILKLGIFRTLIILPQIGKDDLQKIFIHEKCPQKDLSGFSRYQ